MQKTGEGMVTVGYERIKRFAFVGSSATKQEWSDRLDALAEILSAAIAPTVYAQPSEARSEDWLSKINGTHKQFFDAVTVNDGWALGYAVNFLNANDEAYKLADNSLSAVVGLRHFAAPLGLTDVIWAKYELGEFFKLNDPATKQPLARNMYLHAHEGELLLPDMSIDRFMKRGAIFTVCNVAITVLSSLTAKAAGVTPDEAKTEWTAGVIGDAYRSRRGACGQSSARERVFVLLRWLRRR